MCPAVAESPAQQGVLGNLLGLLGSVGIPLLLLGGLFFLFGRRGGGGGAGGSPFGGAGGMNPFEFSKSQSKFNETPNTGVTFDDVAVSCRCSLRAATQQEGAGCADGRVCGAA